MGKRGAVVLWGEVIIAFLIATWFYSHLPDMMAIHWNARGEVDGYTTRFWGTYTLPFMMAGLACLFMILPRIDPLRANYARFRTVYEGFAIIVMLYMLAVEAFILLWNSGIQLNANVFFALGVGGLFFVIGWFLEKVSPNWFIGIRTPWTLSSPKVWEATHRLGALLFKALGLFIVLVALFLPNYIWMAVLGGVAVVVATVIIYSFWAYEREQTQRRESTRR